MLGLVVALFLLGAAPVVAAPGSTDDTWALEVRQNSYRYRPHQFAENHYFAFRTDLVGNRGEYSTFILEAALVPKLALRLAYSEFTMTGASFDESFSEAAYRTELRPQLRRDGAVGLDYKLASSESLSFGLGLGLRLIRTEQNSGGFNYNFREILPTRGPMASAFVNWAPLDRLHLRMRLSGFALRGPLHQESSQAYCCSFVSKSMVSAGTRAERVGHDIDLSAGWEIVPNATLFVGFSQTRLWFRSRNFERISIPYYAFDFRGTPGAVWVEDRLQGGYLGVRFEL